MKKFIFLAGLGIGFVIGSRAGRGPYESLERTARQVADDPEVQRRAAQAKDTASRVAQDTAETVKEKAPEVAAAAQTTVAGAAAAAKHRLSPRPAAPPAAGAAESAAAAADRAAARGAAAGEDKPLSS